jgi:5-carboxymethyl-2-hydroxymuconate isomerase
MPATQIDIRMQYPAEQEQQLMNAVFDALQYSFKLPRHDRNIRLQVHSPAHFQVFDHLTQPERFTHITIDCFSGRTLETKRKLYRQLVKNLADFGIPEDHILITLRESPLENWGIRGGQAACDADLGFKVDV